MIHGLGAEGRILPELKARFSLRDGVARIDDLSGAVFGGTLHANGELRVFEKTTRQHAAHAGGGAAARRRGT